MKCTDTEQTQAWVLGEARELPGMTAAAAILLKYIKITWKFLIKLKSFKNFIMFHVKQ